LHGLGYEYVHELYRGSLRNDDSWKMETWRTFRDLNTWLEDKYRKCCSYVAVNFQQIFLRSKGKP
jgi:hypothetical protein